MKTIALFTACCLFTGIPLASDLKSDLEKEQRWRDQVADSIIDGDEVDVTVDGRDVFGIYTEAADDSNNGMIVVHGTGIHPNWDQVVRPVRVRMAEHGWNTLSIQMPILHNEAEYKDYVPLYPEVPPRLQAAEQFLLDKGMKKIVLVAHSQGATMSSYYLSRHPKSKVSEFVAIGMGATQKDSDLNSALALKKINIPVFDLYGSEDLPGVLETIDSRKQSAAHNANYSQKEIAGANHFFDGMNDALIDAIHGWLSR